MNKDVLIEQLRTEIRRHNKRIEELEAAIREAVNAPSVDWELGFQNLEEVLGDE